MTLPIPILSLRARKFAPQQELALFKKPVKILFVSSYIPRKCGIANFTKDLTEKINLLNPYYTAKIAVLVDRKSEKLNYPKEVNFFIRKGVWSDYEKVIDYVNSTNEFDVVCIQHEFGIFGGKNGEFVVPFIKRLQKPVITTLHSTKSPKRFHHRQIINSIGKYSTFVVTMLDVNIEKLINNYKVDYEKIVIIPHGVPDFPRHDINFWKEKLNLKNKTVMSSINLISPTKGIEYAIGSLPSIVKEIPNFLYLVFGETHPSHFKTNDPYRKKLQKMARELKVEKNIRFINRYLTQDELMNFIKASDFYITPYLDPNQIASGALSYAVGAGKSCISTPYTYAKELLKDGKGIIVPFRNSAKIASSVIQLFKNSEEKNEIEQKAYAAGRLMTWTNIAYQYMYIFNYALHKIHIENNHFFAY